MTNNEEMHKRLPIIPVGYRILIKQTSKSTTTSGGIIIATEVEGSRAQKGQTFGQVMAMGPECFNKKNQEPWFKVKDKVRFRAYSGEIFKDKYDENVWWHIMNDEDVLGLINDEGGET